MGFLKLLECMRNIDQQPENSTKNQIINSKALFTHEILSDNRRLQLNVNSVN